MPVALTLLGSVCGAFYAARPGRTAFLLTFGVPALILGALAVHLTGVLANWAPQYSIQFLQIAAAFLIPGAIFGFGFSLGPIDFSGSDRKPVATLDEAECAKCSYPLRGLTTNRCPECGAEFNLRKLTRQR